MWWSSILAIAYERGRKGGQAISYAKAKYRSKFGVWPQKVENMLTEPTQEIRNWVKSDDIRWAKGQLLARRAQEGGGGQPPSRKPKTPGKRRG
jgi:hypothetical protein